ncbi:hypothetical protein GGP41_007778 [Bipolaris sorokiniana]|uniref:Zn(2)-C6 fungal-type domain-containing protein n=1 Tax=Cochliobolus sativus TaxID=45130 RepID=A0A8H5ZQB4_COCSA|nr:hypothetical protein GGP41_007778 [Bipolaris sorokiniana]
MSNQRSSQAPKVAKVRQSCDTCQASKIRCGQERPSCRRCAKYNITCVYSVSRRAGRPRPKRTATNPSTPTQNSSSTQSQSPSNPQRTLPTPDGTSPTHRGCEPTLTLPSQDGTQPDTLQDQNGTQFSTFFLSSTDLGTQLDSHQSMDFGSLVSPLADGMANLPLDSPFALGISEANDTTATAATTNLSSISTTMTMTATAPVAPNMVPASCQCAPMLLQHLGEVANSNTLVAAGNSGHGEEGFLASAVQRSRVLLDHCFIVLSCGLCSRRMSSTLVLCQAMDELSVSLGMGTLWTDGGCSNNNGGGSTSAYEQDRLPLISNLAKDEVRLRCGSYAVRGVDRQVLLRTLMMGRLREMQQAMGRLCQAVETLSSPYRAACARMAVELEKRVRSKVDSFRATATQ